MSKLCIYLDHHATTPMDERVFKKMAPYFSSHFGNPSSTTHPYGWRAEEAINKARMQVAKAINAHPSEIIFTSGATESINTALKGPFLPIPSVKGSHLVTSSIEHQATYAVCDALKAIKMQLCVIRPRPSGLIEAEQVANCLTNDVALVSLFFANHEIGSINPIKDIAQLVRKHGAIFHCDAAQALGRIPIDCQDLNVDLMSLSAHKAYGPKGVGCLYVKRTIVERISPLLHGGGQERLKRSGTLNVPGIVGFGEAARLSQILLQKDHRKIKYLRDRMLKNLAALSDVYVNGTLKERLVGNLNLSIEGIDAEELVLNICRKVAISMGSACSSSQEKKARVLEEIGVSTEHRQGAIRIGLGRFNTVEEIDTASDLLIKHIKKLRSNLRS